MTGGVYGFGLGYITVGAVEGFNTAFRTTWLHGSRTIIPYVAGLYCFLGNKNFIANRAFFTFG